MKAPLPWGPHRLYQESHQPGVEAARSRGWLTHTSQMPPLSGTPGREHLDPEQPWGALGFRSHPPGDWAG